MQKHLGTFAILILVCSGVSGQTGIVDSLKKSLHAAVQPDRQLEVLMQLLPHGQSLHTDTFYRYAESAKNLAAKLGDNDRIHFAEYYVAQALQAGGEFDRSLEIIKPSLKKLKGNEKERAVYDKFNNLFAQVLIKKNDFKAATAAYLSQLQEAEKRRDTFTQIIARSGIGWIKMEMEQPQDAIPWFREAFQTSASPRDQVRLSPVYANLAACYNAVKQNDSALKFVDIAIDLARKQPNITSLANAFNIKANILIDQGRNAAAEQLLLEAVNLRREVGNPFFIISDLTQLAIFYTNNAQPKKAVALVKEGIAMADSQHINGKLPILYEALAAAYQSAGNYKAANEVMDKLLKLKDSLYQVNSVEELASLHATYDVQKKENTIIRQQLSLAEQRNLIVGITAGAILLLLVGSFIFIDNRRRQQARLMASVEKEKLHSYQAVIKAEENERKRIAANLHDSLGVYAAAINSNISLLAKDIQGQNNIPLGELRANAADMVSMLADTIWALKKEALSLTAISDRIKTFLHRLEKTYPAINMEVYEEITTDILLPPAEAFNLIQTVQEAVNNALKHSGSSKIEITIQSPGQHWEVQVRDNGCGMPGGTVHSAQGNGMGNMKERACASGWELQLLENNPNGTIVSIKESTQTETVTA